MKIGVMVGATQGASNTLSGLIETVQDLEAKGFDNVWMANILGLDAIMTMAMAGQATSRIEVGTAVTPSFPRHPSAMAQQAMTAGVATGGRFTLGVGLSHKMMMEDMLGLSYDKPARHMREYLSVLMPLLRGENPEFAGEVFKVAAKMDVPGAQTVPVMLAALGPLMLKIAGTLADGTTTWVTGPKTIEDHIVPGITAAASEAGRAPPRVVCGLPIVLTNDVEAAKAVIAEQLVIYGILPSYRAMLDREGAAGPEDVAIVGDEASLREQIQRLRDIGVTDFNAAVVGYEDGAWQRTIDFLASEIA